MPWTNGDRYQGSSAHHVLLKLEHVIKQQRSVHDLVHAYSCIALYMDLYMDPYMDL